MKLRLRIITALFAMAPSVMYAQQIPNGGMESWEAIPGHLGGAENPVGWETPDILGAGLGVSDKVVEKSTDVHGGALSAQLTTRDIEVVALGTTLTVPGILALGTIVFNPFTLTAFIANGYPMTETPTSLIGYYKYTPAAGDTAVISVILKADGVQVGGGQFTDAVGVGSYTLFEVALTSAVAPDTMQIIVSSSAGFGSAFDGSILYVDDMELTGLSAAENLFGSGIKPNVYPNPANEVINIDNPLEYHSTISVYNLAGEKIDEMTLYPDMNAINVAQYPNGVYLFRITDEGNKVWASQFVVSH